MNQCAQCDAKDQITIAGKSFCSNCGTPASGAASTADVTMVNTPASTGVPAPSSLPTAVVAPLPKSMPMQDSPPPNALAANNASASKPVDPSTLNQLQQPNAQDKQDSFVTSPIPTPRPNSNPTIASPQQPIGRSAGKSMSGISHFSSGQPTTNTVPASVISAPAQPPQVATSPSSQTPVDSMSRTAPATENIGSEISSLDSKDEGVFTDEQLNTLAKTNSNTNPGNSSSFRTTSAGPAANSNPGQVRPMNDIRPGQAGSQNTTIAKPNPAQTPSAPAENQARPVANTMHAAIAAATPAQSPVIKRVVAPSASTPQMPSVQTSAPIPAVASVATQAAAEPKKKSKGATLGSLALSVVGLFLVGAYIWQVNYPNLALKVASSKAGINASLPSYLPNGWKVSGDISSTPGVISYSLANSDNKNVTVNQSRTDWDSQALAENYVSTKTSNYLALQAQGLTIYLYGNGQASWVNHGTLYKLDANNSGLSQDQIIRMATSL